MTTRQFLSAVVLAKQPLPGRVKTRLSPEVSPEDGAALAAAALRDTLAAVDRGPFRSRLLAFDGDPGEWLPRGWRSVPQPGGGLDRRLGAAFSVAGRGPTVLVGMDTPQLQPDHLTCFDPETFDACLGPAEDGGYWSIGFRDPSVAAALISGVPMSTAHTFVEQLRRLADARLRVQLLDTLRDVDTVHDARAVAALTPHSHFAREWARVSSVATSVAG